MCTSTRRSGAHHHRSTKAMKAHAAYMSSPLTWPVTGVGLEHTRWHLPAARNTHGRDACQAAMGCIWYAWTVHSINYVMLRSNEAV